MVSRIKKIFWLLFLLFDFILLGVIVGGVYFLESDASRDALENGLEKVLDRRVSIKDNLDLTFYPWFGIKSGPVHISGGGNGTLNQISVQSLSLAVKVLPLLGGRLELDTIQVKSPVLRIERRMDGGFDLPAIKRGGNGTETGIGYGFFRSVSVRGISVKNATCFYRDAKSGQEFDFSGITIRTGPLRRGTPVAFDIGADLWADFFEINAQAHFKGLADFSYANRTLSLSETSFNAKASSEPLFGSNNTVQATARLDINPLDGSVDIDGLVVQGNAVRLSGSGKGRNLYHSPVFEGSLSSIRFDPRIFFERYLPRKVPVEADNVLARAGFSGDFKVSMDEAELSDFLIKVDDTSASGFFSIKDFSDPWCEFDISADYLKFDRYMPLFRRTTDGYEDNPGDGSASVDVGLMDDVIARYVRMIPCRGKIGVKRFIAGGFELDRVSLAVSPGPDVIDLNIGSGRFHDGVFSIDTKVSMVSDESDMLKLTGHGHISEFSLARAIKGDEGVKILSGRAEARIDSLDSSGRTLMELRKNFKASLKAQLKKARFRLPTEAFGERYSELGLEKADLQAVVSRPDMDSPERGLVGRKLELRFNAAAADPEATLKGYFNGDVFHSIFEEAFRLNFKKADFSLTAHGQSIPAIGTPVTISGKLGYRSDSEAVELVNGVVSSNGVSVRLDTKAVDLGGKLKADGNLSLQKTACKKIFDMFGIDKPEAQADDAFESVELQTSFQLDGRNLKLNVSKLALDEAVASGTFNFPDYERPELVFKLYAQKVDVDRFLPPDEEEEKQGAETRQVDNIKLPEWQFPDEFLGAINATGQVSCKEFRIFDIAGSDITANVDMRDAVISISDIKARFHEGDLAGRLSIGLKKGVVDLDMDFDAKKFQAGLFFDDFTGMDYVKGLTDASLSLSGRSSANVFFVNTLTGRLDFKIKDGEYNLKSSDDKEDDDSSIKSTAFSIARGALAGREGRFRVKDFLLKTNFITAKAKGGFNIPDDSIGVKVKVDIISFPDLYLKLLNTFLSAISGVDVVISGKLTEPHVEVKGLMRWDNVFEDILGLPGKSFNFIRDALF